MDNEAVEAVENDGDEAVREWDELSGLYRTPRRQCRWCGGGIDPLTHRDGWCPWCTALRQTARFVTVHCLELALADKRRGLL